MFMFNVHGDQPSYHYCESKAAKKNDKDATDVLNAQRVSLQQYLLTLFVKALNNI